MKVWITKYALTDGIKELEVKQCDTPTMVDAGHCIYFHKPDWHTNRGEAATRAEQMRLSKIRSLQRSLAKFERLRFT